ncbi:MAG: Precorrin-6B methylase 2 [Lachnospiraceae bacterium]|nr:Precorrin-6B methylase 2 [Lachnospiraceae bacterium]
MEQGFTNEEILKWMGAFADELNVSPEKFKILNICGKNKNVYPSIETHKRVILFSDNTHENLFYELWEAGFGDYDVYVGEGKAPGKIEATKIKNLMKKKIDSPVAVLIVNENTRESYRIGIKNEYFSKGPIHYVCNEIRAVIMSLLAVDSHDNVCIVSGESIVIEAAIVASEGTIIAVEGNEGSKNSMEENIDKFGVHNVQIIEDLSKESLDTVPVPRIAFIVATKNLENDIRNLLTKNPKMQFVIYTLELDILSKIKDIFKIYGIDEMEVMQIAVSKTNKNSIFVAEPVPWLITGAAK